MPSDVIIRRAGPADAHPLAELFRLAYSNSSHPFRSADDVARFLAEPRNFQIVAEEEGHLVASMAMMYCPWNESYELGRALTRPDCRRRGLAAVLMQRVVDWVGADAVGEVFFGFPRVRRIVDLCAALNPPMIVAGHDAGRNVANGSRETHLIVVSIPRHARFVHVTPPVAEGVGGAFVRERIYRPLGLQLARGQYPPDSFVGPTSDWSLEWGDLVCDYNPCSPNSALEITAVLAHSIRPANVCRQLDRVLRAIPRIQHVTVTVLADKSDLLCQLLDYGFELAAYLPAWYKGGVFRYDCVQLVKRRYTEAPAVQDFEDILSGLQPDMESILGPRRRSSGVSTAAVPGI